MANYDSKYYREYESAGTQRKLRAFSVLVKGAFEKYGNKSEKPKILDIGCAFGYFLKFCRQLGFETYGIDVSDYAIHQIKGIAEAEAYVSDIQFGTPFKEDFFDLVTMFEVIEHLERPIDALKEIQRILKPNGLLILATSNVNSVARYIKRKTWAGVGDTTHILLYTPFSLAFTLQRTKYSVLEIKTPQIYPFLTHMRLSESLLKVVFNIPFGGYIWAVAQKRY